MKEPRASLDAHFAERARSNVWEARDPDMLTEREYLRLFAERPGMYIGYTTFRGVVCFLDGYDYAARRCGGPGLDGLREWLLINHLRCETNLGWSGLIKQIAMPDGEFVTDLTSEQELHVLEVLFDLLDKFLAERESTA